MVKKGTKKPRKLAKSNRIPLIEKALHKRTKAELVVTILAIAKEHAVVRGEALARRWEDYSNGLRIHLRNVRCSTRCNDRAHWRCSRRTTNFDGIALP